MKIEKGKTYRVKGNSAYLKEKYGTCNPTILIECDDKEAFGPRGWGYADGNPAAMLFGMRSGMEKLPWNGKVYYGKISVKGSISLGELVHESELETL